MVIFCGFVVYLEFELALEYAYTHRYYGQFAGEPGLLGCTFDAEMIRAQIFVYPTPFLMSTKGITRCVSLWSPYGIGQTIIFLPCGFFLLSFFSFLA